MRSFLKTTIASLFFAFGFTGYSQQTPANVTNVDAAEFKKLAEAGKGIILDVRTPEEIAGGYIANASMINFYDADFVEKINLIPKNKEIYVYCKGGGRSTQAAEILRKNGFNHIYNLNGGIMAWETNNFPEVKPANAKDEGIQQISISDFNKILATDKPVLVDFHTVWCAPCKKMAPVMDALETEYKNRAVVMRIDADKSKELVKSYKVAGVPVFILFKNGKEIWRQNGIISKEELAKHIKENL